MKLNKEWFESAFTSVSPWSSNRVASHRIAWVRVYGVPLPAWNKECFSKVIGEMSREATMVSIDEASLTWEVLEYARLKVRVQNAGSVRWARRMQINDLRCSILIEEEPNGGLGWGCQEKSWEDSSDSVSSSETYVEDTAASVRSGEELNRFSYGVGRRSVREDEGGREEGEGEQSLPKSTLPFLDSVKGGQGKGKGNATKGVRQGHKEQDGSHAVKSPDQVCGGACTSNSRLSEAAKAVIDVECFINQNFFTKVVGRVCDVEARFSESGPNALTQKEEGDEGHSCPLMKEVDGPRGVESHAVGEIGSEANESSLVSARHDDEVVSPNNSIDGTQMIGGGMLPKKLVCKAQPFCCTGQTSVDDGNVGVGSPLSLGGDGAMVKSRSNSPPRRRKKKGFADLGASCPHPRRSVRLSAKYSKARSVAPFREGFSSISISDTGIRICNSRLCDPVNVEEPVSLGAVGKQVGLACRGEEEEVVKEYGCMEIRDTEVLVGSKSGVNNVPS